MIYCGSGSSSYFGQIEFPVPAPVPAPVPVLVPDPVPDPDLFSIVL
jgi:hypothetical protein